MDLMPREAKFQESTDNLLDNSGLLVLGSESLPDVVARPRIDN